MKDGGLISLIKELFVDGNWFLGGFIISLIVFIIWDLLSFGF